MVRRISARGTRPAPFSGIGRRFDLLGSFRLAYRRLRFPFSCGRRLGALRRRSRDEFNVGI
jgi:hypothetical protein